MSQMRYWWVNQNQTFAKESGGNYLWSPKRNKNGARNRFYDNMRVVIPGDIIFSFVGGYIRAISIVQSYCYEAPKPEEFGGVGENWAAIGWRVNAGYHHLEHPIKPSAHIDRIRPLLPPRYAPLTGAGNGLQGVYLAEIPTELAQLLADLIGQQAQPLLRIAHQTPALLLEAAAMPSALEVKERWEGREIDHIRDAGITETEKDALIRARRGQGRYRARLLEIEHECRITHISNPDYLIASHIKPWRHSSNDERVDGENGLMLCPNIDLLFDNGFISFENNGDIILSPVADNDVLARMQVRTDERVNVGGFSSGQKHYLEFHRNDVLLKVQSA